MDKLEIKVLTAVRLAKLFIAGSRWVSKYADVLNDLNVYPVPDGDTGTNMSMTLQAVENDLIKLNQEMTMDGLIETVSESVLLGARGNSGTILSQIIQGFLSGIVGKTELNIKDVIHAFNKASEQAYKSVSEPVEGTILTVMRKVAEEASRWPEEKDNFIDFLVHMKNTAGLAVEETKEMLPKLKEAGVVDAGGKGLFYFLEGFEKSVTNADLLKDLERIINNQAKRKKTKVFLEEDLTYIYCTEFIIMAGEFDANTYKEELKNMGDSMIVAQTNTKTKTHIHTNNPGQVLEIAAKYGELSNIKIDNMKVQHRSLIVDENHKTFKVVHSNIIVEQDNVRNGIAYIAVADSAEIAELFMKTGAAGVIIGGQSNNPSVADFEELLSSLTFKKSFILPNNKNIISTAKLVSDRAKQETLVLETKSMLEGYYILRNAKTNTIDEIIKDSKRNISIEITKAIKDTKVDNLTINKDDYIAIVNGKIKYTEERLEELIGDIYRENITQNTLRVYAIKGKGTTKSSNDMLESPSIELIVYDGEQENYPYYIYIENRDVNMPEIAIVTDSACEIPLELAKELNITIAPILVNFGKESFKADVDLNKDQFWKRIAKGELAKTAQTSPAELKNIFEKLFEKGYKKVISISLSSKMSGQQQAIKLARTMTGREDDIVMVDSKGVTMILGHLVMEAAKMAKDGEKLDKIVDWLEVTKEKARAYFVVNKLDYLEKSGRIGKASALIGGILKMKPILKVEDGEVCQHKKVLGEAAAVATIEKYLRDEAKHGKLVAYPIWGGGTDEFSMCDKLKQDLEKNDKIEVKGKFQIGPVIGAHSGPIYGVVFFPKIN